MIDSNMIKVLWIEDDLKVYKAFRGTASLYNIEFIHADNWIDGKQLLKEQFNEISAIILDAQCKWDKNSIAEDKFLNEVMSEFFKQAGIILVDFKVEFGKDKDGNILLGDEISPDGCRLWDSETLEMLDKELFRKGKDSEVMDAYIEVYNRIIPDDEKVI